MRIGLVVSGFLLFRVLEFVAGYLAAMAIPRAYFQFFAPYTAVSLFLLWTVLFALPYFLLSFPWCAGTLRWYRNSLQQAAAWCFAGMTLAWSLSLVNTMLFLLDGTGPDGTWLQSIVVSMLLPPWYAALSAWAPWLGLAAAVFMLGRSGRSTPRCDPRVR